MEKENVQMLFNRLNRNFKDFKVKKDIKESTRGEFVERIKEAKENVHLFGMNFPNYYTKKDEHPILSALETLNTLKKRINVYIYFPSDDVLKKVERYTIYKRKNLHYAQNRNLLKRVNMRFSYINVKVCIYDKFYRFGASAIDLGTGEDYLHISKAQRNEYIKDAEYFDIELGKLKDKNDRKIFMVMENFFKTIEKSL